MIYKNISQHIDFLKRPLPCKNATRVYILHIAENLVRPLHHILGGNAKHMFLKVMLFSLKWSSCWQNYFRNMLGSWWFICWVNIMFSFLRQYIKCFKSSKIYVVCIHKKIIDVVVVNTSLCTESGVVKYYYRFHDFSSNYTQKY